MQLIILAAGKSSRIFGDIEINKCLIKYNKKTLIEKLINDSKKYFKKINIVLGFNPNLIKSSLKKQKKINFIKNDFYKSREMLYSIILALKKTDDDVVISYSDIIVSKKIWPFLKKKVSNEISIPTKINWKKTWIKRKKNIYDDAETLITNKKDYLIEIGKKIKKNQIIKSQFMGLLYIPKSMIKNIIKLYNKNNLHKFQTTKFLQFLINKKIQIRTFPSNFFWYEIDDLIDLKQLKK